MNIGKQGLSMLYLRMVARGNNTQRERMTDFYNAWIKQIKLHEKTLKDNTEGVSNGKR